MTKTTFNGVGKPAPAAVAKLSPRTAPGRSDTVLYAYLERTLKSDRMRRTLHEGAVEYETGTQAVTETAGGRRA